MHIATPAQMQACEAGENVRRLQRKQTEYGRIFRAEARIVRDHVSKRTSPPQRGQACINASLDLLVLAVPILSRACILSMQAAYLCFFPLPNDMKNSSLYSIPIPHPCKVSQLTLARLQDLEDKLAWAGQKPVSESVLSDSDSGSKAKKWQAAI